MFFVFALFVFVRLNAKKSPLKCSKTTEIMRKASEMKVLRGTQKWGKVVEKICCSLGVCRWVFFIERIGFSGVLLEQME